LKFWNSLNEIATSPNILSSGKKIAAAKLLKTAYLPSPEFRVSNKHTPFI
jgi:hypothetical protein